MIHEWSRPVAMHEAGATVRTFVSFCRACGLLSVARMNAATHRGAMLFVLTDPKSDTIEMVSDPGCKPSNTRRTEEKTKRARSPVDPIEARATAHALALALGPLEVPREQWRELTDQTRMVHVSKYAEGKTTNLYGPIPRAWCGAELGGVSWTTLDLLGARNRFDEGDAICLDCARKARAGDRRARRMLPYMG